MPKSETKSKVGRNVGMIALLLGAVAAYGAVALNTLRHGRTTFDEVGYLIRSWWYATGAAEAYTGIDATWQMPLYFYELGWWQRLAGVGHHPGRILSVIAGVLGAAILFAIVRRLTGNMLAAAAAVLIFIATPATAYAFSMATPAAIVSTLHLAAIWLIVSGLGRPRTWASCALGVLCALIFFTRQNMLLGIVVLIPLYIAAIGRDRRIHGVVVVATAAIVTATILVLFPTPLAAQAIHLPVLTPYLIRWGVLPPDFGLIEQGTIGVGTMAPAFGAVRWAELLDTLVLPFAGVILSALIVFLVARGPLKVLWIAPLYFLWLIVAHVFASAGYCQGCMIDYTPYFAGVGALAGGLGLAVMASLARKGGVSPVLVICLGAALATALSTFAPILARNQAYRYYPAPQLVQTAGEDEVGDMDLLARWLKANPKVAWVNYAGLEDNECYALHKKYCPKGAGSVFTFGLKGDYEAGLKLVNSVKLFSHLANVGDTRSLIIHPASTTHRQLSDEDRTKAGAGNDVVRLSIGIEDAADIIADLDQALA